MLNQERFRNCSQLLKMRCRRPYHIKFGNKAIFKNEVAHGGVFPLLCCIMLNGYIASLCSFQNISARGVQLRLTVQHGPIELFPFLRELRSGLWLQKRKYSWRRTCLQPDRLVIFSGPVTFNSTGNKCVILVLFMSTSFNYSNFLLNTSLEASVDSLRWFRSSSLSFGNMIFICGVLRETIDSSAIVQL
jgi:hypothetical protein